ncbi:uncharacterized protein LOC135707740 [Ochlerotatus camptorhynchus]|uniref:uncharacterized protein LOC135707740 n=1 Tax=Ochlerotatus camptorhynchus TaxID=644619 RepID=UPI0031DAB69F
MLEIEEVIINDGEAGYGDAEYLGDEQPPAVAPADNVKVKLNLPSGIIIKNTKPIVNAGSSASPSAISSISNGESAVPVKRKAPIIRKAGEIVTPIQKPCGTVTVSPSTIRPKVEWSKVTPPGLKVPLTTFTISSVDGNIEQHLEGNEMEDDSQLDDTTQDLNNASELEQYTYTEEASSSVDLASLNDKLSRIEHLLEKVVAKQGQHDAALKALKFNIKDLRIELKNSDRQSNRNESNDSSSHPVPMKRERKRLVVFPIADDNYLLRLEDLIQVDEEIRTDLSGLFGEAPAISVYEFMRKNCHSLFEHTSKYTWTGKSAHNVPSVPPSNPAHKLAIVELLISCGCEKFPYMTRDIIEKEFRRALTNFNESRVIRLKRKMEKSSANQTLLEEDV